jgi:hypothetical protein
MQASDADKAKARVRKRGMFDGPRKNFAGDVVVVVGEAL